MHCSKSYTNHNNTTDDDVTIIIITIIIIKNNNNNNKNNNNNNNNNNTLVGSDWEVLRRMQKAVLSHTLHIAKTFKFMC